MNVALTWSLMRVTCFLNSRMHFHRIAMSCLLLVHTQCCEDTVDYMLLTGTVGLPALTKVTVGWLLATWLGPDPRVSSEAVELVREPKPRGSAAEPWWGLPWASCCCSSRFLVSCSSRDSSCPTGQNTGMEVAAILAIRQQIWGEADLLLVLQRQYLFWSHKVNCRNFGFYNSGTSIKT